MAIHSKGARGLRRVVDKLLHEHRENEARVLVNRRLSELPKNARRTEGAILDILSLVEISANRPRIALEVLARRRSLRSRDSSRAFDDSLLVARLLMTTEQSCAARAELTELLSKPKAAGWDGILSALGLYLEAEEQ
jgi:hypothetical protein